MERKRREKSQTREKKAREHRLKHSEKAKQFSRQMWFESVVHMKHLTEFY